MANAPEAILFDIDGTLIDSNELHVHAWDRAFREAGHKVLLENIRRQIGKGGDKLVPALLPGTTSDEQRALADRHGAIFKTYHLDQAKPFPGASELLRTVHANGRKVVLASSAQQDEVEHYIRLLGVEDIVDAAASADDVEQSKPAPDIFSTALDKIGAHADHAVVVGDTVWDAEAAHRVGLRIIGPLSGGASRTSLEQAGTSAMYQDVSDLLSNYRTSLLCHHDH